MRPALAACLLLAGAARAADGRSEDRGLAVLDLVADPGTEQAARNLIGLITTRLASYPVRVVGQDEVRTILGFDKARAAAGCNDDRCLVDIGGALGVRYLVHGALGRIGETFLLRLTLTDLRRAAAVHRVVRKEHSEEALIDAAESAADELAVSAGFGLAPTSEPPARARKFAGNLKLGNTFARLSTFNLSQLNLSFDLEGDYFFTPQLAAFLQIGLVLGRGEDSDERDLAMTIVPAAAGAKWFFIPDGPWNPYVGLGVGMGFVSKILGRAGDTSINFHAMGGVEYFPWRHVGFNLEASLNLADFSAEDAQRLRLTLVHTNFGLIYAW